MCNDTWASWWLSAKESTCQCRRYRFDPWVRKIPWSRKWQPTPVFLPGKFHQQRSPVGYSPWSCKRVRYDLVTKQNGGKMEEKIMAPIHPYSIIQNSFTALKILCALAIHSPLLILNHRQPLVFFTVPIVLHFPHHPILKMRKLRHIVVVGFEPKPSLLFFLSQVPVPLLMQWMPPPDPCPIPALVLWNRRAVVIAQDHIGYWWGIECSSPQSRGEGIPLTSDPTLPQFLKTYLSIYLGCTRS